MLINLDGLNILAIKNFIYDLYKSTFVHQIVGTFTTRVFLILVGLITSVLTARILGPEGVGLFAVATTIGAIGVQFGNLGLHASNTYYVAKSPDILGKLLGNTLFISFGFGGFGVILAGFVFHLVPQWSPLPNTLLLLSLIWIPIGLSYLLMQNLLLGTHQVRAYNLIEIVVKVLAVVLMLAIFFAGNPTVEKLFFVSMLSLFIGLIWALKILYEKADSFPQISLKLFQISIRYGIKAYLAAFFSFLVLRADILMVNQILGEESAGFYSIAANMADMVYMLPVVIGTLLFPRLSGMDEGQWELTLKMVVGVGLLMVPLIGIGILFFEPMIGLLYGQEFLPAVKPFIWLMPGIFLISLNTILMNYLASGGMPIITVVAPATSFIINILLNIYLIANYGILGAAYSSCVAYGLMFVFNLVYIRYKRCNNEKLQRSAF